MSQSMDVAREVFITGLRNQHAVERQARELIERQLDRIINYPEMLDRMRLHLQETNEQARRIEEVLGQLGESHSSVKDAAMSFMGNMAALAHAVAPDEVVKNSFANFAFENFEIAAYKSLLTLADLAGTSGAVTALKTSLGEEESMARWIEDHLEETTRAYVNRRAQGETAGR